MPHDLEQVRDQGTIIVVFAFIRRGDELLLVERALPPYAGMCTIPGGHKKQGEALRAACLREMEEETGLALHSQRIAGIQQVRRDRGRDHICVYYVADSFSGAPRPSKEGKIFWASGADIASMKESHPALRALWPFILNENYPFDAEAFTDAEGRGTYSVTVAGSWLPVEKRYE